MGTNKVANLTNTVNLATMANLTIFRQRPKFKRMSSREGYQQSGKSDEFGENGKFDDMSLKVEIQLNELKRRVPTRRIWRVWRL